jgi:hypothetical protein
VLYLIEDLLNEVDPRMSVACTSQTQTFHQGSQVARDPQAIHLANYNKSKYNGGAFYNWDPRPPDQRCTTTDEIHDFINNLEQLGVCKKHSPPVPCTCQETCPPMWLDVIQHHYDDYEVDEDRLQVLQQLSTDFVAGLQLEVNQANDDSFSNDHGVHFGTTIKQADSTLWFDLRKYRVTASILHDFVKYPMSLTRRMLWEPYPDLSRVVAIQWGVKHEEDAIKAFAAVHGQVSKVGLFVSKIFPFIGASPDGFWKGCVIEVKCPYILCNKEPWDLEGLTAQQKRNLCVEKVDGNLKLKRRHKYFWQIQCQMFVTGTTKAKFIV